MCDTCGDVILFTDWVQLALDEDHEVWFCSRSCLCGSSLVSAFTVMTAGALGG